MPVLGCRYDGYPKVERTFEVTVKPRPDPSVVLIAPEDAYSLCGWRLDASNSYDTGDPTFSTGNEPKGASGVGLYSGQSEAPLTYGDSLNERHRVVLLRIAMYGVRYHLKSETMSHGRLSIVTVMTPRRRFGHLR